MCLLHSCLLNTEKADGGLLPHSTSLRLTCAMATMTYCSINNITAINMTQCIRFTWVWQMACPGHCLPFWRASLIHAVRPRCLITSQVEAVDAQQPTRLPSKLLYNFLADNLTSVSSPSRTDRIPNPPRTDKQSDPRAQITTPLPPYQHCTG